MTDQCPISAMYKEVNFANHLLAVKLANLGPADPRQPSSLYWGDKMDLWRVPEGEARSRLCMNCEHYDSRPETIECIKNGEGGTLKASELPLTPQWADIPGMPSANCTRWAITCSALRTCDDWEPCAIETPEPETVIESGTYVDMVAVTLED